MGNDPWLSETASRRRVDDAGARPESADVQVREHMGGSADGGRKGNAAPALRNADGSLILETPLHQLEHILEQVPEDGVLLEWGSGTSTIWFAERLKKKQRLVTIEHNEHWFFLVRNELSRLKQKQIDRLSFRHCPPTNPKFDMLPYGHPAKEIGIGMSGYIWGRVDADQDSPIHEADVLFVDGVSRGCCLAVAAQVAKPEAVIFLHDAERSWYSWATNLLRHVDNTPSGKKLAGQLLSRFRKAKS